MAKPSRLVVRVALALGAATAIAVGLVVAGIASAPSRRSDLWFEIAKGGIELFVVVILGGAVTAAFKYLDASREERRRVGEFRLDLLHKLVEAYQRTKAVRRTLRAYGFGPSASGRLNDDQVKEFRQQMRSLVDAQLELEWVGIEVEAQRQFFGSDADRIKLLIDEAEGNVHNVIKDWEEAGMKIVVGAEASSLLNELDNVRNFLTWADEGDFREKISDPVKRAERLIRSQLLGAPR